MEKKEAASSKTPKDKTSDLTEDSLQTGKAAIEINKKTGTQQDRKNDNESDKIESAEKKDAEQWRNEG